MALPTQIYVGVVPNTLYLQDQNFQITQWGYDVGTRKFLTHPGTNSLAYPQRNQRDSQFPLMFVTDVVNRLDESGLYELTVSYKGLLPPSGPINKQRLQLGADTQMFSIAALSSGSPINLIAPVPNDIATREFVTSSLPTRQGVGRSVGGSFLGGTAGFSITFVPDPNAAPPPKNYTIGWVLEDRSWEDVASSVFLVTERYRFFYTVAA